MALLSETFYTHFNLSNLNLNFRIMETDDISELEINEELRGMISGNFESTSDVEERQRQENIELPQLLVEEEVRELPEHRFVVKDIHTSGHGHNTDSD